jgi:hypothetical protein
MLRDFIIQVIKILKLVSFDIIFGVHVGAYYQISFDTICYELKQALTNRMVTTNGGAKEL